MAFKTIKGVDHLPADWELNEECTFLRRNGKEIPILEDKIELEISTGVKKSFGVRTLYWSSWGKPTERFPSKKGKVVQTVIHETTANSKKPVVAKKLSNSSIPSSKQLVSNYLRGQLLNIMEKRVSMRSTAKGIDVDDGKSFLVKVLLHNVEKKMLLVRVYCANWRDGFWYFNPNTAAYLPFVKETHKPGYGDISVIWPEV